MMNSMNRKAKLKEQLINYDLSGYRKFTAKSELDKCLHTLEGILNGISFDSKIDEKELSELYNWCMLNSNLSDVQPIGEIVAMVESILEDGILDEEELLDLLWVCNNFKSENIYYDVISSDIQRLQGILHGILADNEISEEEIIVLKDWLNENNQLSSTYPYDEIKSLVLSVLNDGILDEEEKKILKVYFTEFIDTKVSANIHRVEIDELKKSMTISGICAASPNVVIENNVFCFTGASSRTIRSEIKEIIESKSGIFQDNITKKLNYLVIGDEGNPCWVFSCYGRKVEKAIEYRKSGIPVQIIHENDFWKVIN